MSRIFDHDQAIELADWAQAPERVIETGAVVKRGPGSREQMRTLLEAAATNPEDATSIRSLGGRPSLSADQPTGNSPTWHVRVPPSLDASLRQHAHKQHRPLSDLVREACTAYISTHQ